MGVFKFERRLHESNADTYLLIGSLELQIAVSGCEETWRWDLQSTLRGYR
jgi:hypothetical protein